MEFLGVTIRFRNEDGTLAPPTGSDGTYSVSIQDKISHDGSIVLRTSLGYEIVLDSNTVWAIRQSRGGNVNC